MITLSDMRFIVDAYKPYDSGYMFLNGNRYNENNTMISAIYDTVAVPYIWYQEKGFRHYKSGKFIKVNQYFIQEDTVNALDFFANNANAGERSLIQASNKRTVQARTSLIGQGVIDSINSPVNRSDDNVIIG